MRDSGEVVRESAHRGVQVKYSATRRRSNSALAEDSRPLKSWGDAGGERGDPRLTWKLGMEKVRINGRRTTVVGDKSANGIPHILDFCPASRELTPFCQLMARRCRIVGDSTI
ncbi:hypothetical protein BJY00DRAFT_94284 [Aspergillus carlsbadensis]|nr:hypothetical protein BJY00DRAFT_94284 [Aspergillus carlsbadensis]